MRILFGHVCKHLGHELIEGPNIFSGVPVHEWPRLLWELFPKFCLSVASDYSAFEKFFTGFVKDLVSYTPYMILAQSSPVFLKKIEQLKQDEQQRLFRSRCFTFEALEEFNRSGSHQTYDINTFGHYCVALFFQFIMSGKLPSRSSLLGVMNATKRGLEDLAFVLSGDDRVEKFDSETHIPPAKYLAMIGLEVEYLKGDTSFCKTVSVETESGVNKGAFDFWEALLKLPWTKPNLRKHTKILAYTKAKCLSALYNFRSVPIINKICAQFLYKTRAIDHRIALATMCDWDRNKYDEIIAEWGNGRYHEQYIEPTVADVIALSERTGIPVDIINFIHARLHLKDDFSCDELVHLQPYIPRGFTLIYDTFVTDSVDKETWMPPVKTRDLM